MKNIARKFITLTVGILALISIACNVNALPPAAPTTPPTFDFGGSGGGGGGGGGGGSYTPPTFKPYEVNASSSDGQTACKINVKDYYLASVLSSRSLNSGNNSVDVGFTADLIAVPSSPKLDIQPVNVSNVVTPLDADLFENLLAFSLTRSSSTGEWALKDGTIMVTLKLPEAMLNGLDTASTFYLLKNDGSRFIMYSVVPKIANGFATFEVPLWYETKSPSTVGTFALAGARAQMASNSTPTATPTPAPATPTPVPKSGSEAAVLLAAGALAVAAVCLSRRRKP